MDNFDQTLPLFSEDEEDDVQLLYYIPSEHNNFDGQSGYYLFYSDGVCLFGRSFEASI